MVVRKFVPIIPVQTFAYLITKAFCNIYHSYYTYSNENGKIMTLMLMINQSNVSVLSVQELFHMKHCDALRG